MSRTITFFIIIPFKSWSSDLEECLTHIKGLSLQEFEVILLMALVGIVETEISWQKIGSSKKIVVKRKYSKFEAVLKGDVG